MLAVNDLIVNYDVIGSLGTRISLNELCLVQIMACLLNAIFTFVNIVAVI